MIFSVCIKEHKIASYLKLKKDDRLLVSCAFGSWIRPEAFLKVRPDLERRFSQNKNNGCIVQCTYLYYAELYIQ